MFVGLVNQIFIRQLILLTEGRVAALVCQSGKFLGELEGLFLPVKVGEPLAILSAAEYALDVGGNKLEAALELFGEVFPLGLGTDSGKNEQLADLLDSRVSGLAKFLVLGLFGVLGFLGGHELLLIVSLEVFIDLDDLGESGFFLGNLVFLGIVNFYKKKHSFYTQIVKSFCLCCSKVKTKSKIVWHGWNCCFGF